MAIASDVYKVCVCMYVYMFVCKYCVDSSRVSIELGNSTEFCSGNPKYSENIGTKLCT